MRIGALNLEAQFDCFYCFHLSCPYDFDLVSLECTSEVLNEMFSRKKNARTNVYARKHNRHTHANIYTHWPIDLIYLHTKPNFVYWQLILYRRNVSMRKIQWPNVRFWCTNHTAQRQENKCVRVCAKDLRKKTTTIKQNTQKFPRKGHVTESKLYISARSLSLSIYL